MTIRMWGQARAVLRFGTAPLLLSIVIGCAMTAGRKGDPSPAEIVSPASYRPVETAAEIAKLAAAGDSAAIARAVLAGCRRAPALGDCYEHLLVPLAGQGMVKLAMGSLNQLGALDAEVRKTGHVYAHAIGIAAGSRQGDVSEAFAQCSESYQSGCYHGVIQAYFARLDSISATEANALCEPFRGGEGARWIRFQCVHGMGHGLTMLYAHDLRKGLDGCDLLRDQWDRHSCYSGAFMENIVNVTHPHHPASALSHSSARSTTGDDHAGHAMQRKEHHQDSQGFKAVDPADPHYPCSIMPDRHLRACYEMQTSVMLYNNKGDMAGAARACDSARVSMRTVCYASLGRDISSYSQQNHAEGIRMCSLGTPRYQPWCYYGLVKNFIDLNARAEDGLSLCRDVPAADSKLICYAAVGEQVLLLTPSEAGRIQMCANAEASYRDACLYGSRVNAAPPDALREVWKAAAK